MSTPDTGFSRQPHLVSTSSERSDPRIPTTPSHHLFSIPPPDVPVQDPAPPPQYTQQRSNSSPDTYTSSAATHRSISYLSQPLDLSPRVAQIAQPVISPLQSQIIDRLLQLFSRSREEYYLAITVSRRIKARLKTVEMDLMFWGCCKAIVHKCLRQV